MQTNHKCVRGMTADGVITVDGKRYPMASEVIATEDEIYHSMKQMAKRLAMDYKHKTHRNTANVQNEKNDDNNNKNNNKKNNKKKSEKMEKISKKCGETTTSDAEKNNNKNNNKNNKNEEEAIISDDNPLILLSILKGSYLFTADMVRLLRDENLSTVCDFLRLSSYNTENCNNTGSVNIHSLPKFKQLKGKHLLVLEDICDSGHTLSFLETFLKKTYEPKSLAFCVLVDKPAAARKVPFTPNYFCLKGPNRYLIGYGFEVNDRYRDLRHIFALKEGEAERFPCKL